MEQKESVVLGADVSKQTLDCAAYPVSDGWHCGGR